MALYFHFGELLRIFVLPKQAKDNLLNIEI